MGIKQEIEALLFCQGKPMTVSAIADTLNHSPSDAKRHVLELVREYELREGGLYIAVGDKGYSIEPREEYLEKIMPIELKTSALRTLAVIALKEPIKQTEVIALRGSGAYEHIKDLVEAKWIIKEQEGNSFIIKTTPAFRKHFKLSNDGNDLKGKLALAS